MNRIDRLENKIKINFHKTINKLEEELLKEKQKNTKLQNKIDEFNDIAIRLGFKSMNDLVNKISNGDYILVSDKDQIKYQNITKKFL
jgi:hypothetical protein